MVSSHGLLHVYEVKHPWGGSIEVHPLIRPVPTLEIPLTRGSRRPVVALLDYALASDDPRLPSTIVTPLTVSGLGSVADEPVPNRVVQSLVVESAWPTEIAEHGTFNAGIIRQRAPGAHILSADVVGPGGISSVAVRRALAAILDRAACLDPALFVDVVCLPFGFVEGQAPPGHMKAEKALLDGLAAFGVLVVAAAGNEGTEEPLYPAAFAAQPPTVGPALLSVGALTTDGQTHASYSSRGDWVTHWEIGEIDSIVADPPGGYALGIGTSFAATTAAARLAVALADVDNLTDVTPTATIKRAGEALDRLSQDHDHRP